MDYDIAQICEKGHVINPFSDFNKQDNKDFCPKCGSPVISSCPSCGGSIKGGKIIQIQTRVASGHRPAETTPSPDRTPFDLPLFCQQCGAPFPWAQDILDTADELIRESSLSEEEKRQAEHDIQDLVRDTPRAQVAVKRLKRLSEKAGGWLYGEIRSVIVDIASESVKKLLMG